MSDTSLANAAALLSEMLGLNPEAFGRNAIEDALALQMTAMGCTDPLLAVKIIATDPKQKNAVTEQLIPGETWFFRDQTPFELLRQLAASLAGSNTGAAVRILSAPCSTGEEPYSIAITMLQAGLPPERFRIVAADLSTAAIEHARKALYRPVSFRGADPGLLAQFFNAEGNNFRLKPDIAGLVDFQPADICSPEFLSGEQPFDVIFCRNFLIYLHQEAQMALLATLKRLMKPDAALFTGHPETAFFSRNGFEPVQHPRFFAMRPGAGQAKPAPSQTPRPAAEPHKPALPPAPSPTPTPMHGLETAKTLADKGELLQAEAACRACLQENPANSEAWHLLGLIAMAGNNSDAAKASFSRALYLEPDNPETLLCLSLLHEQGNDAKPAALYRKRLQSMLVTK